MTNALTKGKFSASTDGLPILVAATGSPGTLIHTAVAGTTAGTYDEIWLWLQNNSSGDVVTTIEFGASGTTNQINYTVVAKDGLKCVLPGLVLQNAATVRIYAATANAISAHGFINAIAHS